MVHFPKTTRKIRRNLVLNAYIKTGFCTWSHCFYSQQCSAFVDTLSHCFQLVTDKIRTFICLLKKCVIRGNTWSPQVKVGGAESFFSELPRVNIDFRGINSLSSRLAVFWSVSIHVHMFYWRFELGHWSSTNGSCRLCCPLIHRSFNDYFILYQAYVYVFYLALWQELKMASITLLVKNQMLNSLVSFKKDLVSKNLWFLVIGCWAFNQELAWWTNVTALRFLG